MQAADSDSQHYDRPRLRAARQDRASRQREYDREPTVFGICHPNDAACGVDVCSELEQQIDDRKAGADFSGFRVQRPAFEVSDRKPEIGGQRSEVRNKTFIVKSREKTFVAATTDGMLEPLSTQGPRASMQRTQVVDAENSPARMQDLMPMDCQSHYDAIYDFVVYGIRSTAVGVSPVDVEFQTVPANLAGELDDIFHELVSRKSQRPLPQAGAMNDDRGANRWTAFAAAFGAWIKYQVGRVMEPKSASQVGWADYAEFADRGIARNVATIEATETSDANKGVRSSTWLRHSAALSLHQLSLILEAAATEINDCGRPALSAVAK